MAGYGKYALMSAEGELLNHTRTGLATWLPKAYSMCKKPEVPPEAEDYIAGYGKYSLMGAKRELSNQNHQIFTKSPTKSRTLHSHV